MQLFVVFFFSESSVFEFLILHFVSFPRSEKDDSDSETRKAMHSQTDVGGILFLLVLFLDFEGQRKMEWERMLYQFLSSCSLDSEQHKNRR